MPGQNPATENFTFTKKIHQGDSAMPDIPGDYLRDWNQTLQKTLDCQPSPATNSDEIRCQSTNSADESVSFNACSNNSNGLGEGDVLLDPELASELNYFVVNNLKTDFYEKLNGDVVVRVQPKPLDAKSVNVCFDKDRFDIVFSTRDPKFLSSHVGSNETTRFRWTCQLAEFIVPDQCTVRVQSLVEITLRKEDPSKKWMTLTAIQPPKASSGFPSSSGSQSSKFPTPELPAPSSTAETHPVPSTLVVGQPSNFSKPACEVPQYNGSGQVAIPGYTGLRNLGNTCFMNAPLQALINTRELRDYFLNDYYHRDINRTNPLGLEGKLAEAFGQFVAEMWNGMDRVYEPTLLKTLVGSKASQFANFAQHDAQEFLSFLLDGLHEDLNRVIHKPLTPTVESDGRPDQVVADEAWRYHLMRNDSFIADVFHGQLKSRLVCPECENVSITFDPFVYLPVPFPKSRRPLTFYYWSVDVYAKPIKYTMSFMEDDSRVSDLFSHLSGLVNGKPSQFCMVEVFRQKVFKRYNIDDRLSLIRPNDTIFVFQVYDPKEVGEEVVELTVLQRQLYPRMPISSHCAGCGKESQQLRACTKCRTAAYCDVACQKDDWTNHRVRCRPPSSELVGEPFLLSLPASRLTFQCLVQCLEARARHTVDVFQAPMADSCGSQTDVPAESDVNSESAYSLGQSLVQSPSEEDDTTDVEGRPRKRIRVVFGEPHQQPRRSPLFQLAQTDEDGEYVYFDGKQKRFFGTDDDRPLDLTSGTCLAMDWINKKGRNRDHLVVLTKDDIDCIEENMLSGNGASDTLHLSNLFDHFTETETLSADDAWYCNRCRQHRQALKTLQLWRLPSVLIVQLKRFVYTASIFRSKIDKHVAYPLSAFDVRPYMCEGSAVNETVYDLYAVVCHSGTSFFGHYTAFARLPRADDPTKTEIEWRSFDDTSVTRVQRENDLIDGDAYFLFYKRRGDPTDSFLDSYTSADGVDESDIRTSVQGFS